MSNFLSATHISKSFFGNLVLNDISFFLKKGEVLCILGANGSGKTTLLRILAGFIRPDKGKVELAEDVKLSFCGHKFFLYNDLTVMENLHYFASLNGVDIGNTIALIEKMHLTDALYKPFQLLSQGQKKKLSLIRSFISNANIFLLDEPTSFLDMRSSELVAQIIKEQLILNNERSFIIVTHDINLYKKVATKGLLLKEGILHSALDKKDIIVDYYKENR